MEARDGYEERPVHPHVRGEYGGVGNFPLASIGSSPRAWGILLPSENSAPYSRFIPTCVGNTSSSSRMIFSTAVHPHVRGEYTKIDRNGNLRSGSSPRAWGILTMTHPGSTGRRFIPTCVGNTKYWRSAAPNTAVHPHVRGEYGCLSFWSIFTNGSSPRAWGIRAEVAGAAVAARFIPTCVGNTDAVR